MFSERHKTWHMTSEFITRRLTALAVLIPFPRLILECAFLSLSLFSHPPSGAECLMEAVKSLNTKLCQYPSTETRSLGWTATRGKAVATV